MRQIPYGSALERMLAIYFKVSWNSWKKNYKQVKDLILRLSNIANILSKRIHDGTIRYLSVPQEPIATSSVG